MNILMTGGTGLIGRAFIERFAEYSYTVLTRSVAGAGALLPDSVRLITSLSELANLNEFDAVINLAGEPIIGKRWSDRQKDTICQSRWQVTRQLVELFAASERPPSVFLSGSAIGAYGDRGDELLTEQSGVKVCDFPTEVCLRWEEIAGEAQSFTRVVLLRTGIVLDNRGGALAKMLLPFKFALGGRLGNGRQFMSWIHVRDQVEAMAYLLAAENLRGAVNLVAPNPVTNRDFTQALARGLHRPAPFPVPAFLLQKVMGEASSLLLDSERVAPRQLLDSGFQFTFPDVESALADLLA